MALLNQIRDGDGAAALAVLAAECLRPLPPVHGVRPTQLFSRNKDVDDVNNREMLVRLFMHLPWFRVGFGCIYLCITVSNAPFSFTHKLGFVLDACLCARAQ